MITVIRKTKKTVQGCTSYDNCDNKTKNPSFPIPTNSTLILPQIFSVISNFQLTEACIWDAASVTKMVITSSDMATPRLSEDCIGHYNSMESFIYRVMDAVGYYRETLTLLAFWCSLDHQTRCQRIRIKRRIQSSKGSLKKID